MKLHMIMKIANAMHMPELQCTTMVEIAYVGTALASTTETTHGIARRISIIVVGRRI